MSTNLPNHPLFNLKLAKVGLLFCQQRRVLCLHSLLVKVLQMYVFTALFFYSSAIKQDGGVWSGASFCRTLLFPSTLGPVARAQLLHLPQSHREPTLIIYSWSLGLFLPEFSSRRSPPLPSTLLRLSHWSICISLGRRPPSKPLRLLFYLTSQEVNDFSPLPRIKRMELLQAHEADVVVRMVHNGHES